MDTIQAPVESLHRLAGLAGTYADRVRLASRHPGVPGAEEQRLLLEWQAAVAPADLEKRLAWDGQDLATPGALLRELAHDEDDPLPDWTNTFRSVYGAGREEMAARFADCPETDRVLSDADPVAFQDLFLPAVRYAREQLRSSVPHAVGLLLEPAQVQLERALLIRLAHLCQRALFASFSVRRLYQQRRSLHLMLNRGAHGMPDQLFKAFIQEMREGGLYDFFAQHSVAARLMATAIERWIEVTAELARRLEKDAPALLRTFDAPQATCRVRQVQTDLGDTHDGGRAVMVLELESGLRLVYKPRPIPLEVFYGELVAWFNGQHPGLELRAARVLARPTHGWIEYIDHQPCDSEDGVRRFYERSGMVLALVHALDGADFHSENIIAAGDQPVLIDHEALMSPRSLFVDVDGATDAYVQLMADTVSSSVVGTGLLPVLKEVEQGIAGVDLGGLTTQEEQKVAVQLRRWRHVNTDLMKMDWEQVPVQAHTNVPRLDGCPRYAGVHVQEVVSGFRRAYELVLRGRAEIEALLGSLRGAQVRFLFRHTSVYATLLERCLHPRFLADGRARMIQLEVLARALLATREPPAAWPLLAAEVAALEEMDIPLFATEADARSVRLPGGDVVEDFFDRSPLEQARTKLRTLSTADMEEQTAHILSAFRSVAVHGLHPFLYAERRAAPGAFEQAAAEADWEVERAVAEAVAIADELEARAIRTSQGDRVWVGIQYMPKMRRHAMRALSPALADGFGGIALLNAAVARVTGSDAHRQRALEIVQRVIEETRRQEPVSAGLHVAIGAGTGAAGMVYVLSLMGRMLDATEPLAAAGRLVGKLTEARIETDTVFDVMGGGAGAVLGALAYHAATGDDAAADLARRAGRHLVERCVPGLADPDGEDPRASGLDPGVPHGGAGIALALLRLHALTAETELLRAADVALGSDKHRLAELWPATAPPPALTGWANGTVGLGFAQLVAPADSAARQGLDASIRQAEAHLLDGNDDLANGALGRADLLLTAGIRLQRPALTAAARAAASAILTAGRSRDAFRTGWGDGVRHPGLFQGDTGIAYQLLRTARPDLVPSVLWLEGVTTATESRLEES